MVVGLFALSLVMIVGGVASVVQGFPYVRLESGLAMVIAGATAFSAGVVLLGLSAAVQRLKRIEESLRAVRFDDRALSFLEQSVISIGPNTTPPSLAEAAALAGLAAVPPPATETSGLVPAAPELEQVTARERAAVANKRPARTELEPPSPDLPPPDASPDAAAAPPRAEARDPSPPAEPVAVADDLFVEVEPKAATGEADEAAFELRSSLDDAPKSKPKPAEPAPPPEEKKPEAPPVVGTYSSGGNTYVMFADGTIEADTPRGRFTFGSLDELKVFVEGGGEDGTRGAA